MTSQVASRLEPWHELKGKVVMITGASSGLGKDFCLDLAKAGCKIIAAARRIDRLKRLCDEINQLESNSVDSKTSELSAVPIELDISSNGPAIEAAVQKAWNAFGRIDALINNAGVRGRAHTPLDLSEEEWNNIIKTNLTGTWLVSKYVCIRMRDAKQGGSVINISSIAGLNRGQLPGGLAYAASKVAINTMTKNMENRTETSAKENGKAKIAPGSPCEKADWSDPDLMPDDTESDLINGLQHGPRVQNDDTEMDDVRNRIHDEIYQNHHRRR